MPSISDDQLTILARLCIGRRDDYARQVETGRYVRAGAPLSREVLRAHLLGSLTIGTYVIDEAGNCRFAVFDADDAAGLLNLLGVQRDLSSSGVASYLEGSRRGGHLWVFFSALLSARLVRHWLLPLCPSGVEFYPKRDWATRDEPGSLIRVPLGVHRRSGCRYPFLSLDEAGQLVPVASSVTGLLNWLAGVRRVEVPARDVQPEPARRQNTKPYVAGGAAASSALLDSPSVSSIHQWCATQDAVAVIGCYVSLDARGMGCCPFGWHHSDGKDSHPSLWVHVPRAPGAPSWYCHAWRRGGNLFDFLCLWYGAAPREMWRRILAGESF